MASFTLLPCNSHQFESNKMALLFCIALPLWCSSAFLLRYARDTVSKSGQCKAALSADQLQRKALIWHLSFFAFSLSRFFQRLSLAPKTVSRLQRLPLKAASFPCLFRTNNNSSCRSSSARFQLSKGKAFPRLASTVLCLCCANQPNNSRRGAKNWPTGLSSASTLTESVCRRERRGPKAVSFASTTV